MHKISGLRNVEYDLYIKPMINCTRDDEKSLIKTGRTWVLGKTSKNTLPKYL
jgi:hypothetical protein